MATHTSVLAWRIPGTGEPGRLPSMGSHRVGHNWSDLAAAAEVRPSLEMKIINFFSHIVGIAFRLCLLLSFSSHQYFWGGYCFCCCCSLVAKCPTLCDSIDCSPPGSTVHGILQARILEWINISFSRGPFLPRDWTHVSCLAGRFFTTEPPRKP